ncbi:hypothetical protein Pse7367_3148 [Thalassoporum mexicanum PCC 7367]|nr:hypothetical protein Pse7367_3148 [Pseudanabaena sp. PCC 7367]
MWSRLNTSPIESPTPASMSSYPVALLPVSIQRALREEPQVPMFDEQAPKPPTDQEPQPVNVGNTVILALALILGIVVMIRISKLSAGVLLVIGLIGITLRTRMQSLQYQNRLHEYDQTMEQYYAILNQYSARAGQHQNLVNRALSPENLANFRAALATEILKQYEQEAAIATDLAIDNQDDKAVYGSACASQVRDLLAQYFSQYFGAAIQADVLLTLPQLDNPYLVDFVYGDREHNLYIAIVIDVPYDLKTKTALNYVDAWQDRLTSQALHENGWILLKFAEEQVWRLPKSCCRELAKLVATVSCKPEIMAEFRQVGELPRLKQWSKKRVEQLATNGYREKYLSAIAKKNSSQNP